MSFGNQNLPLVETEEPFNLQHDCSSGHLSTEKPKQTDQIVITPSLLHIPVLSECRTGPIFHGQTSVERPRASLGPSFSHQLSSITSAPPRNISVTEQASPKESSASDPRLRSKRSSPEISPFSQADPILYSASLAGASTSSYPLPPDHPPKIPKTEQKRRTQQLIPSKQNEIKLATPSHSKDEVDSPGPSSSTSSTLEAVVHAPTPQRFHSLAQPTTGRLRPLQSAPIPDAPHEALERGWSTAPSLLGAGSGAQPYPIIPLSQPYHLREPAIPKRLKNRRTGPERSSLKDRDLPLPRRTFLLPKKPAADRVASAGSSDTIAETSQVASPIVESPTRREVLLPVGETHKLSSNIRRVVPALEAYAHPITTRSLLPSFVDYPERDLDCSIVRFAAACPSVTCKSETKDLHIPDWARKSCNSFLNKFKDLEKYKDFLSLRGGPAQTSIDLIQDLLDKGLVEEQFWVILVLALARLCRKSALFPQRFFLKNVVRPQPGITVAEGHFGEIEKGVFNGKVVCIKMPKFNSSEYPRALSREVVPWAQICHENVLPFYGIFSLNDGYGRFGIVSPYLKNGNVVDFLKRHPDADRPFLIYGVASGMAHLHDHGLVHGDIKGGNILVADTDPPRAVLADFGFTTVADANGPQSPDLSSNTPAGGTKQFEAPELFNPDISYRRTSASDVYAFSMTTRQIYQDRGLDDSMWNLIENCWDRDDFRRPSAREILERLSKRFPALVQCTHTQGWGDLSPSWFKRRQDLRFSGSSCT
ncbi:hypothetical protein C0989_007706 [Termitomyces sp. Mn162]|nr:hypothetical protein C0989_007706 [Termitomyces sp. Mn162]